MVLNSRLPALTRLIAVALAALAASGCYYMQAARGQLSVMGARQPIQKVIARPTTSDALKSQLTRARRIREFASRQLGLPDNAAYTSYADIGRRFVVWNVVATPEFSVEPRTWCFPIAGCVAYRGYFREKAANAFADARRRAGDDVVVGGVPAYSTLGRIADPLLNTVAGYSELDLAALIFHELAHQVAYWPGNSSWNEAFATAVEEAGVARYAARLGDPAVLQRWQQRRRLRVALSSMITQAREDLARLYRQRLAPEALREAKRQRLAGLAAAIRATEKEQGMNSGFGAWIDAGLNNAHLASVATYYERVPHFEDLLKNRCGDYLPCLYVLAKQEQAK
ncbi:MAG TPA: aminopeptidase [Steroidobacteraceae bacterium]|nr:aminopeptidase [Steroidobacteraceae bacterium]